MGASDVTCSNYSHETKQIKCIHCQLSDTIKKLDKVLYDHL